MIRLAILCSVLAVLVHGEIGQHLKKSPYEILVASKNRNHLGPKILMGEEAVPHEFPFMAMLTETSGWQYCGASLLDKNWVLTAAHCVVGTHPEEMLIRLGSHNKYVANPAEQTMVVDQVIVHQEFIQWNLTNDIALLHLKEPAQLTHEVFPICIDYIDHNFAKEELMTVGWGTKNAETGETSDVLLKLQKVGVSNNDCIEDFKPSGLDHAVYEGSLCAYGGGDGRDVCFGDSGSPLVWRDWYGSWRQVGLTSWGLCATQDVPAVYTRVGHFFDWIRENAVGAQIC